MKSVTKVKKNKIVFILPLIAMFLYGCCSTGRLKEDFWQNKTEKIGIAIEEYPAKAGAYRVGDERLLDMIINNANTKSLRDYLDGLKIAGFDKIKNDFEKRLTEKGKQVVKIEKFMPLKRDKDFYAALAEEYKIDLLLVLSVERFGTIRKYGLGLIPIGAPKALFEVRGKLIDLRTKKTLWSCGLFDEDAVVRVEGQWDQPYDYPNITAAMKKAMKKGKQFLLKSFFEDNCAE